MFCSKRFRRRHDVVIPTTNFNTLHRYTFRHAYGFAEATEQILGIKGDGKWSHITNKYHISTFHYIIL